MKHDEKRVNIYGMYGYQLRCMYAECCGYIHTNVRIGIVHTCGHVSVFCSSFRSSIRCFCSSVCASYDCTFVYHCAHRFIFRPSICLIFRPSVCMSVCVYVHMYLCKDELSGHRKLNWLDWYLVWLVSSLDTHFIWLLFFCVAVQTTALPVCAPFYAKTVFTIAKKVHIYFWAIALYYEGCSNMNASSFITFFTYMLRQNGKRFCKGLYVTLKLAPDLKKNTVYLSSYSPLNEGHVRILTLNALNIYQWYRRAHNSSINR